VQVRSIDRESLLVDFLSELLYLSDVNNEAYLAADIHQLTDTYIKATVYGVKITGFQVVEIKAVTYHDLHITDVDGVWQADIVFDI
ncbi:MAG: archease, partial [Candidatus Babeliales bacterium]|nr:archease [Candidatus Babeliales bacterium]